MPLRRLSPLALALGLWACKPTVPYSPPPAYVDYAVFDLESSPPSIPQPNDLTLEFAATVPGAQGELLRQFVANGGFPYDQEVPVTVDFTRLAFDAATGDTTPSSPDLDVSSLTVCTSPATSCNLLVLRIDTLQPGPAPIDAAATSYAAGTAKGTLTLRNHLDPTTGSRRWPAGARYLVAIRGGADGIQTTGGGPVYPEAAFSLLLQGEDLSKPENASLLPPGFGPLLEQLRQNYLPVFAAVDNFFPSTELAVLTTFQIAPAGTWVLADPGVPVVPLPSDFLLDPATGTVVNNPAFGALAPGIATLDGFSTTAMILSQTSGPIQAASVRDLANLAQPPAVFLYKLGGTAPVEIHDLGDALASGGVVAPGFVAEPPPIVQGGFSEAIGLQPATPASVPGVGDFFLPPLDDATEYAVLITNRVKDAAGNAIRPTTLGKVLLFANSICTPSPGCVAGSGVSQLVGISAAEAGGLEGMRLLLAPAVAKLEADHAPLTRGDVAMAYTFRTQSITGLAVELAAIPYQKAGGADVFPPAPVATVSLLPDAAGKKYGVLPSLLAGVDHFVDATVVTYDLLDDAYTVPGTGTGAFHSDPTAGAATPIPALVAIPASPLHPAPLVIFRHGLDGTRAHMMLLAASLASRGMVVAAIDAAKHGDRAWCMVDSECGTACVHDPALAHQGDLPGPTPGTCTGGYAYAPILPLPACSSTVTTDCWDGTGGETLASGDFFVSANLFRLRDSMRQDVIDESMLARVLTTAEGQAALGVTLDASKVYYVGQSLGAIAGAANVAANPRFAKAVLNVGGGTFVDIAITSPTFASLLAGLLASLGIAPGSPEYLQFVNVAKWVIDPADPANFAPYLTGSVKATLASPLGSRPTRSVLGQAAYCDDVVPNPTNQMMGAMAGLQPLQAASAGVAPVTFQWFVGGANAPPFTCPTDAVTHGVLLDGASATLTAQAQSAAGDFLLSGTAPTTPVRP